MAKAFEFYFLSNFETYVTIEKTYFLAGPQLSDTALDPGLTLATVERVVFKGLGLPYSPSLILPSFYSTA